MRRLIVPIILSWPCFLLSAAGEHRSISNGAVELSERPSSVIEKKAAPADPTLATGFPVRIYNEPGGYQGGAVINPLVGNIDSDPELEILVTGLAPGPPYAFNYDGSAAAGWPVPDIGGAVYMSLAELDGDDSALEVVAGYYEGADLVAYKGDGSVLPGWSSQQISWLASPPTSVDLDADGIDEVFAEGEDEMLHAFRADGTELPSWPSDGNGESSSRDCLGIGSQERHTPAIADLDGDGRVEIVSATSSLTGSYESVCLTVVNDRGAPEPGFPFEFIGYPPVDMFAAIGDVDGDGWREIVVATGAEGNDYTEPGLVYVLNRRGIPKQVIELEGRIEYGTAPALADLDGDRVPEIVVQSTGHLHAFRGDGSALPGWPAIVGAATTAFGNSSPVVGDIDGDLQPDIAVSNIHGALFAFDRFGRLLEGFPKDIDGGNGGTPAIADVDLDGRNELVYTGDPWDGSIKDYDRIWMYDLGNGPHGAIHWGQFGHDAKRTGRYEHPALPDAPAADLTVRPITSGEWNVREGETGVFKLGVRNLGTVQVRAASLTLFPPTNAEIISATVSGRVCDLHLGHATCYVSSLQAKAEKAIDVTLLGKTAGALRMDARVIGLANDPNKANDLIRASGTVNQPAMPPPPPPSATSGESSGGGAWPVLSSFVLVFPALFGRRRKRDFQLT